MRLLDQLTPTPSFDARKYAFEEMEHYKRVNPLAELCQNGEKWQIESGYGKVGSPTGNYRGIDIFVWR
jgi:hypothetical protein